MGLVFLVLIILPISEIYVIVQVAARIGAVNTFFALLASAVLGFGIIRGQGMYLLWNLRNTLARGESPTAKIVHSAMIFIGGIFLIIPGFISDFIGLLFILPGTRHLIAAVVKARLVRNLQNGNLRVFSTVDFSQGFGQGPFSGVRPEPRDVSSSATVGFESGSRVIDVKPLQVVEKSRSDQDPDSSENN